MKVIDDKFRAKLKKLATEFFSNRDRAIITKLNVEMLIPAGIDYKEYVQPGKSLLKKFFEQFPDIFRVFPAEMNGGRQVLVELATPISWEACAEEFGLWLIGVVNEQYKGKMLDSYFPAVLEKYASPRIKSIRALYTKGQKAMLDDLAARGLIIHDTSDPTGGALNVQTKGVSTPVKTDGGEVGYMHSISFMGYWNSEKTKLKKICADPDINYSEVVAHNFIRSILLNKVRTADTVQGRRYIFDTGLKTETNEIIYGVMEENPLFATNQSTHRYLRDMWAYNGMNVEGEEAELWEEIYNQCNLGSEAPNAFYIREKVVSKINTIDVMIEKADAVLSDIGNTIKSGKQIDRDLIEFIEEYYNVYESIKENLVYFNIRADEDLSVSVIEEKINSKNINMTVLDEIKHLVKELCGLYTELFTKYGLMTYKIEEDIIEFSALLEEGADAPDKISECYEKLGVYSDFAYSDKRSQEHMDYFGITVQMALINAAIGNDASINDIASVVEKIKDRRNYLYYEEIDDENSELHYAVGENGVSVAISKSWETDGEAILVDKISEYFPKLTDLEEIIVSGTKEELEKYIDDNSYIIDEEIDSEIISSLVYENLFDKLECAKRLYAVEGNKNRQAEHMLLRADKSVETVKLLLDIMNEEERAEDYWHIFSKTEGMTGIGLSYYCDAMRFKPDKISELVANHPELEYCAQSAELLIAHYETEGNEAAAQKCRENLEKFSSINLNIFEMAVVEGRFDDAKKYVEENITDTDTFSVDMVADIGQRLVDASKKNNCGALALYAVQKNHRATAEALLWQEVFSDEREDVLCTLSEILYQE
ncbi:MAG: hypothetical protein IJD30_05330, partial [Clostridia bacterium]|nr:hypothetical protein [Clostridia bacterium]